MQWPFPSESLVTLRYVNVTVSSVRHLAGSFLPRQKPTAGDLIGCCTRPTAVLNSLRYLGHSRRWHSLLKPSVAMGTQIHPWDVTLPSMLCSHGEGLNDLLLTALLPVQAASGAFLLWVAPASFVLTSTSFLSTQLPCRSQSTSCADAMRIALSLSCQA